MTRATERAGRDAPSRPDGTSTGGVPTVARRPQLDGLRTLAVYLVVLFHCGVGRFAGGFVGVDVFFVLSGYLVTGVLLRSRELDGRVRLGRFYARRCRRLLPASALTILATTAAFTVLLTPVAIEDMARAARAALLYVANWFFIRESTDYFANEVEANPFLHFWSLAVEEQFYLLWPLVLSALWWLSARAGRAGRHLTAGVVTVGAAVSLGWALSLRSSQPTHAYFGTDTRAYQLLIGALLALVPGIIARTARRRLASTMVPVGVVAVVVLASSVLSVDPIVRGALVAVAAATAIVGLEAAPNGAASRLMAIEPIAYLGRISYGTYLAHWPIAVALDDLVDVGPLGRVAVVGVGATALAALSHRMVELPVQTSRSIDRMRYGAVVGVALAVSVVAALIVVPRIADDSRPGAATVEAAHEPGDRVGLTPIPPYDEAAIFYRGYGETRDCVGRAAVECVMVSGSGTHVHLIGDSTAQMLVPAFVALAEEDDLTFSVSVEESCTWQRGDYRWRGQKEPKCRAKKEDAYERVIPQLDPDVVVAVNSRWVGGPHADDVRARALRDATFDSVDELSDDGRRAVVLVEPPPRQEGEGAGVRACLSQATYVEECRFVAPANRGWYVDLLAEVAGAVSNAQVVDIGPLICPFLPICDPFVDGVPVFRDVVHINPAYSEHIAGPLGDFLRAHRLLDG